MNARDYVRPASIWSVRCACRAEFLAGRQSTTRTACTRPPWRGDYAARVYRSAEFRVGKLASVPPASSRPLPCTTAAPFLSGRNRLSASVPVYGALRKRIRSQTAELKCEAYDGTRYNPGIPISEVEKRENVSEPRQYFQILLRKQHNQPSTT